MRKPAREDEVLRKRDACLEPGEKCVSSGSRIGRETGTYRRDQKRRAENANIKPNAREWRGAGREIRGHGQKPVE